MLGPIRGRARAQLRDGSSVVLPQQAFKLRHPAMCLHKAPDFFEQQRSVSEGLVLQELLDEVAAVLRIGLKAVLGHHASTPLAGRGCRDKNRGVRE